MLNIDNNSVKLFTSLLDEFGVTQIVSEPTGITNISETLIDVILTSDSQFCTEVININVHHLSDHMAISFCIDLKFIPVEPKTIFIRDFKNANYVQFFECLENICWRNFYNCTDVNAMLEIFNSNIIGLFDTFMPIRSIIVRKSPSPWITDVIKIMIKFRNNAFATFRRTRSQGSWDYYKSLRNLVTKSIRLEKQAYLQEQIKNNKSNLWNALKKFNINVKPDVKLPDTISNVNSMNDVFLNSSTIHQPSADILSFYSNNLYTDSQFTFSATTETEIYNIFLTLRSQAMGADGINLKMLKLILPSVLPQLTHLINFCLVNCVIPDLWKLAIIKPIAKCKSPSSYNDLRPISILPTLSKILEKVMHCQISMYLSKLGILPDIQSGFRAGYSTTTALLKITDDIICNIDKKHLILPVLLDFSKAFDTVNHELLLAKLKYIGFNNDSLKLILNYFSNRCQRVALNNETSESVIIERGVAQGSICGPLFFCIYTFDLYKCVNFCNLHIYADDTQVYLPFKASEYEDAVLRVNSDLENIYNFATSHCLVLNGNKSAAMLFGNKNTSQHLISNNLLNITLNHAKINFTAKFKNLGLILDTELRFSEYVTRLIKKAYLALKNLYMNRFVLCSKYKQILADSLVLSVFNYCDAIYGPCLTNTDAKRIQKLQNSCVRFIFGLRKYDSVTERLKALEWLNMQNRRKHHFACLIHRTLKSSSPPYLDDKISFRANMRNRNLRDRYLLHIPSHHSILFKRCFSYNCAHIYNQVPDDFKDLKINVFSIKFKHFILSQQQN